MKLALLGEILIDVILGVDGEEHKMRLGGVTHSALAAWSVGLEYEVYYFAPDYLEEDIQYYLSQHGCSRGIRIGDTKRSPGVILIGEAKELGDQQYSLLMSDVATYQLRQFHVSEDISDFLIFPGGYDLKNTIELISLEEKSLRYYIDIANGISNIDELKALSTTIMRFEAVFNSTSHHLSESPLDAIGIVKDICLEGLTSLYILKENRGGGRLFYKNGVATYPAFLRQISHSVGVGDSFDVFFIYFRRHGENLALRRASLLAAEYASTSFPDDLKKSITNIAKNIQMYDAIEGVFLPIETRSDFKIYIAAPDFDWIDTKEIRRLEQSLTYHNFSPILPIKINGQIDDFEDVAKVSAIFSADVELIHQANILIAVLLNDDAGTLVEIGYAAGLGKPVLVYDPFMLARNPMVTELPRRVSNDLDIILNEVFILAKQS